jgi:vitamin B12 transporter
MKYRVLIRAHLCIFFVLISLSAQTENLVNEKLIVSASRYPITFNHLCRSVEVLDSQEIAKLPVNNVQDLIAYIASVDMRARGILGVQADASIRGSSFEQVLVLVDGVKMNNSQTGHFNLNLPLTLKDIERIEILKGAGSRVYGAGAFGGVINIITKRPDTNSASITFNGGEYGFYDVDLSASLMIGKSFSESVSFQKSSSDGFTHNTDFDISTMRLNSNLMTGMGGLALSLSRTNREYGANSFYSDNYSNQWENTSSSLLSASANLMIEGILFLPKFYWARSDDTFLLDRYAANSYKNESYFDRYGAELHTSFETSFGTTSLGGEYSEETLSSIASGDHERDGLTFFAEQQMTIGDNLHIVLGASAYIDSSDNNEISPGIDFSYQLSKDLNLYASINKAFRLPSFTELYYTDPVHRGNPALSSETAWTYEIGGRFDLGIMSVNVSCSRTEGTDLIDWVREEAASAWETRNIRDARFDSYELSFQYPGWDSDSREDGLRIYGSYIYTYGKTYDFDMESKYVFDYLKYKVILSGLFPVFDFSDGVIVIRYEERVGKEGVCITDAGFSKDFDFLKISIQIKNLFDIEYRDIGSVPMPGRWIFAAISFNVTDEESQ